MLYITMGSSLNGVQIGKKEGIWKFGHFWTYGHRFLRNLGHFGPSCEGWTGLERSKKS